MPVPFIIDCYCPSIICCQLKRTDRLCIIQLILNIKLNYKWGKNRNKVIHRLNLNNPKPSLAGLKMILFKHFLWLNYAIISCKSSMLNLKQSSHSMIFMTKIHKFTQPWLVRMRRINSAIAKLFGFAVGSIRLIPINMNCFGVVLDLELRNTSSYRSTTKKIFQSISSVITVILAIFWTKHCILIFQNYVSKLNSLQMNYFFLN